jgi:hypothetical protein
MSSESINHRLDEIAKAIATGGVVLVLGEATSRNCRNISSNVVPSATEFFDLYCEKRHISASFTSTEDKIDYFVRNEKEKSQYTEFLRETYTVRDYSQVSRAASTIAWRRIYSLDFTDELDLAYRKNPSRAQAFKSITPFAPLTKTKVAPQQIEIVKLNGDALQENLPNVLVDPNYSATLRASPWFQNLQNDIAAYPTVFVSSRGDGASSFAFLRSLRRTQSAQQILFVCEELQSHQIELVREQGIVHLDLSAEVFFSALSTVFPQGLRPNDVFAAAGEFTDNNPNLIDAISSSFSMLTHEKFEEISMLLRPEGAIWGLYKGDDVKWSDIVKGTVADLTPYKNWRGRIESGLKTSTILNTINVLISPAGMGKTVGLMTLAFWIRQRSSLPILWMEPDGDLKGFLLRVKDSDFPQGAFLFVDDIMNHYDSFDGIESHVFEKFCFLVTSRETRWARYRARLPVTVKVKEEVIRPLNHADAVELLSKISRYGTTVHFRSNSPSDQVSEILERSQRDMLVLIRELGQGQKFDDLVWSEFNDLNELQRLAYAIVCLTDRNQVPLPVDVYSQAIRVANANVEPSEVFGALGRVLSFSDGRRTVKTRHATIAFHIANGKKGVLGKDEIQNAAECLLSALSRYQIPIIVHHSNSGIARVFKNLINARFLTDVLGVDIALVVYGKFEKSFERDGFFWQQYGLCQLRARRYEEAIKTLRHAFAVHDHFQIRHSLGVACLMACKDLGPSVLAERFDELWSYGRELLSILHGTHGHQDDLPISTLAELDCALARKFSSQDIALQVARSYHTKLAFYIRDYPSSKAAPRIYQKLDNFVNARTDFVEMAITNVLDSSID